MTLDQNWQLLLLGGASGAGKSHSAREIAESARCSWLQLDSIWLAMAAVTTPETHPALHLFATMEGPWFELTEGERLDGFIEASRQVSAALAEVVAHELESNHRVVLEGAWMTPAFAAEAATNSRVRSVFITEHEMDRVQESMLARSEHSEPTPRQRALARLSWAHSAWLRDECERLRVATVQARPRATLTQRVLTTAR